MKYISGESYNGQWQNGLKSGTGIHQCKWRYLFGAGK